MQPGFTKLRKGFCLLAAIAAALVVANVATAQTTNPPAWPESTEVSGPVTGLTPAKPAIPPLSAKPETKKTEVDSGAEATGAPPTAPADENNWRFEFTPYLWMAGLTGTIRARDQSVTVEQSFGDVLKSLKFTFAFRFEAAKDRWGVLVDNNYLHLGKSLNIVVPGVLPGRSRTITRFDQNINVLELGGFYEVWKAPAESPKPSPFSLDVLGGVKIVHIGNSIDFIDPGQNLQTIEGSTDYAQAFVGARAKARAGKKVIIEARYDVALASEYNWTLEGLVEFPVVKRLSMGAGYRASRVNKEGTDRDAGVHMLLRGPIVTGTIHF